MKTAFRLKNLVGQEQTYGNTLIALDDMVKSDLYYLELGLRHKLQQQPLPVAGGLENALQAFTTQLDRLETRLTEFEQRQTTRLDEFEQRQTARLNDFENRQGERLDHVTTRLGGIDTRLAAIENRVGLVEVHLGGVNQRLRNLEGQLQGQGERLNGIDQSIQAHGGQLETLRLLILEHGQRRRADDEIVQVVREQTTLLSQRVDQSANAVNTNIQLLRDEAVAADQRLAQWTIPHSRLFNAAVPADPSYELSPIAFPDGMWPDQLGLPPLRTLSDVDALVLDHLVTYLRGYQLGNGDEPVAVMRRMISEHIGRNPHT